MKNVTFMFKALIIAILLLILAISNASAIQDPFLIYGYVKYSNGSMVESANLNISVPEQTIIETTNSMGKYIGVLDNYQDGDEILIIATKGTYTGSALDILNKTSGGLMINITIHDIVPPEPITNLMSTTGNFWINWTWNGPLDSDFSHFMVYIDNIWVSNISDNYYNETYPSHSTRTISIKTVDLYGNVNNTWVNQTTTIPNNPIFLSNISSSMEIAENQTINVDIDAIDSDFDTPVFYCNRTDLFLDFNPANGQGSFTPSYGDSGIYNVDFGVTDGYGSISNKTMLIIVNDVPLSIISNWNSKTTNSELVLEAYNGSTIEFNISTNRNPTTVNWYVNGALKQSGTSLNFYNNWNATGTYYVNVSLSDEFDIVPNMTWTVNVLAYPFTYSLRNGWNLISLPIINSYTAQSLSSIIGSNVEYITSLNPDGYLTYVPGFGPEDFPILPDQGYFIYLSDNTSFTVSGAIPHIRNVNINKGWNLLGWTSLNKSNVTAAFIDPLNSSVDMVVTKTESGDYRAYIAGFSGPEDNFDVEPGNGYYIYANSNAVLEYGD